MKVVIRADAGTYIGNGHIMRCLTLAVELRHQLKADVLFVCRDHQGALGHIVSNLGFECSLLPAEQPCTLSPETWLGAETVEDAQQTRDGIVAHFGRSEVDLLIVDHYCIDASWHQQLRPITKRLVVIDDLANRFLDCDVLIDQTFTTDYSRYNNKVPAHCLKLLGSCFSLLRTEFSKDPEKVRTHRKLPKERNRILVSMGGTDPENVTADVLRQLFERKDIVKISTVLSSTAPNLSLVRKLCANRTVDAQVIVDTNDMASIMMNHDIAIGACGSTSWERCAMGMPSITMVTASNQLNIAANLDSTGASSVLSRSELPDRFQQLLDELIDSDSAYSDMVDQCLRVCDGLGSKRVLDALTQ